jgi:hypothetical protein
MDDHTKDYVKSLTIMTWRKLFTEIEQAKRHNVIQLNEFHPKMSVGIMSESGFV